MTPFEDSVSAFDVNLLRYWEMVFVCNNFHFSYFQVGEQQRATPRRSMLTALKYQEMISFFSIRVKFGKIKILKGQFE